MNPLENPEPRYHDVEFDKIPDAWVITWWLPDNGAILRLKAHHSSVVEEDHFVAQLKMHHREEFHTVHEFTACIWLIDSGEWEADVWRDLPPIWMQEFKALVRLWARVRFITELGEAGEENRYASEPHSSRDHIAWAATRDAGLQE